MEATRSTLARWLVDRLPATGEVEVGDLVLPAVGASNETILFTASWMEAGEERRAHMVLRVQPVENQLFLNGGGHVFFQWQMMEAVQRASDVPVPGLRWREADPNLLGAPFFVMDRVHGEVPNGYNSALLERSTPEERRQIYVSGLEMLARVHQVDWRSGFEFLFIEGAKPGLDQHLGSLERWYRWARAGRRFDHVEAALRYLWEEMPQLPPSLVWGDSRPGNMMFDPSSHEVTAVLDWEMADLASPETDLGWWLMFERLFGDRLGVPVPDGVLGRDETLSVYESHLGRPLGDVHYHDVLAWTKFAVTCIRHVDVERGGPNESMFEQLGGYVADTLTALLKGRQS
jgi:aminoglycoside phosphotransferase (APT) family kinase protein